MKFLRLLSLLMALSLLAACQGGNILTSSTPTTAVLPIVASVTPVPAPTNTPAPLQGSYKTEGGEVFKWDGQGWQPVGLNATDLVVRDGFLFLTDESGQTVGLIALGVDGNPDDDIAMKVVNGIAQMDGVFYRVDVSAGSVTPWLNLEAGVFGRQNLVRWDEATNEWTQVQTWEYSATGKNLVPVSGRELAMGVTEFGVVVTSQDGLLAVLDSQGNPLSFEQGIVTASDGTRYGWDGQSLVAEYDTNEQGDLLHWQGDATGGAYLIVLNPDNQPYRVSELRQLKDTYPGYLFGIGDGQVQFAIDARGNLQPSINGEVIPGWYSVAYENGDLVAKDMYFDAMIKRSGHETIATDASKLPISVTLNEAAMGVDVSLSWNNQATFTRYWLEVAFARMQDDGTLPANISSYNEFINWLNNGGVVTLKQLSAWNPETGQVETFENIPIKNIQVYITLKYQGTVGQPALPMGITRYAPSRSDSWSYDAVYDNALRQLILITEIDQETLALGVDTYQMNRTYAK